MISDEELERWLRISRTIRDAQGRNYLDHTVGTTTESPEDWDEESTTVYEPRGNTEYSLTPENRHERRKAEAIARKNSKPRSDNASNRINRKGRKW
jgi:hypothetical protein